MTRGHCVMLLAERVTSWLRKREREGVGLAETERDSQAGRGREYGTSGSVIAPRALIRVMRDV